MSRVVVHKNLKSLLQYHHDERFHHRHQGRDLHGCSGSLGGHTVNQFRQGKEIESKCVGTVPYRTFEASNDVCQWPKAIRHYTLSTSLTRHFFSFVGKVFGVDSVLA